MGLVFEEKSEMVIPDKIVKIPFCMQYFDKMAVTF